MDSNIVFSGLGSIDQEVDTAGNYFVRGKISLPTLVSGGGASELVVTINLNSDDPIYTGEPGAQGFETNVVCAADDVIHIVLTSSADADNALNAIKSVVQIGLGV